MVFSGIHSDRGAYATICKAPRGSGLPEGEAACASDGLLEGLGEQGLVPVKIA